MLTRVFAYLGAYREAMKVADELYALTDRDLSDIGLVRSDIGTVVRNTTLRLLNEADDKTVVNGTRKVTLAHS